MKKLLLLLMCCLLLTACTQQKEEPAGPENNPTTQNADIQSPTETDKTTETPTAETHTSEPASCVIDIYFPNENLDGFVTVEKEIDELSANSIIAALIEAGVLTEGTAVNSMTMDGTTLNIDFNEAFRDLIFTQGSTGEVMIMGSMVNTFLSAYGAESVEITVNGEILESGHVIYDFPMGFFQ